VTDWQTISALATAGGTLVLAVATFGAIRSANRSARVAERAFLTNMRPLLISSQYGDPPMKALWNDRHVAKVEGGRAVAEHIDDNIYLAIGVRNVGSGIALMHGWSIRPGFDRGDPVPVGEFRRLAVDLYVPPNGPGYWESALRDPAESIHADIAKCIAEREPFIVDILYGDQDGGQRTISRFVVLPANDESWYTQAPRHWNVDRPAPR
jgi:hypothetical protein